MYISLQGRKGRYPLYKTRDLTDADIAKLASWPSWPHIHAAYYALGKVIVGDFFVNNIDPTPGGRLSEQIFEIIEKFLATRRVKLIDAPEDNSQTNYPSLCYHVKPIVFVTWLHKENLHCDPRLSHAVYQHEALKTANDKTSEPAVDQSKIWCLPSETDPELWQESITYISGDGSPGVETLNPQVSGGKKTGTSIRMFRQKAYYRAALYVKHGCQCLHPIIVENVKSDLANETTGLNKPNKINDYIEDAVIAVLERKTQTALRVCSPTRYPYGRPGAPQSCPFHQKA